jgi:hypothetical protein
MARKKIFPMRDVNAGALTGAATSFSSEWYGLSTYQQAIFHLNVTAVSGTTPNMVVTIQELDEQLDPTQAASWHDLASFTAVTAATNHQRITINPIGMRLRAKYVRTGTTPSFTFTLTAYGVES